MNSIEYLGFLRFNTIQWRVASILIMLFIPIHASFSQAGLVYSALRQGTWSIYFQTELIAPPRALTEANGDGSAPALAPDGQRIAFEGQGGGISVCPLDSSTACRAMAPPRGTAVRPVWHPVTGELLFVRYLADGTGEDADILVTRGGLASVDTFVAQTGIQDYPDVSPDGRLLVYTSSQTISLHRSAVQVVQNLWVMSLETGTVRQLTLGSAQDTHPDWSPSGHELAFASNRTAQFEIWVVSADGNGLRQVTSGPGAKTWPAWSPDGQVIMFTLVQNGRQGLWLIDADGTNLRPFEPFGPGVDIELKDADWR
jgi:Tol biopolymer transport system component